MLPTLAKNLGDVVHLAIEHDPRLPLLVLHDTESPLARLLTDGYRLALPTAAFLEVGTVSEGALMATIDALPAGALVVLVQSSRFTIGEFRFRLELFRRRLAVVEHPHLGRMRDEEIPTYVDALAYDRVAIRGLGSALKARIDVAARIELVGPGGTLVYSGPFEDTKRNVGDYAGFATIGGQFPIGEVFTEPVDLQGVNGIVPLASFGAADFSMTFVETPFFLDIERGRIVAAPGAPPAFEAILAEIRAIEGAVWIRELGFGINPALTATRTVNDVGTYERMCGVHISMGAKHAVYAKTGIAKRNARFHVDVFPALDHVSIDGDVIYTEGRYTLGL